MPEPGHVYTPIYTTYDDLYRLLGANKLAIRIGDDLADHVTQDDALYHLRDVESWVTAQMAKRFVIPFTLTALSADAVRTLANISLYRAAYTLWLSVPGAQYQGAIPEVVKEWKTLAADLLADVLAGKLPLYGATKIGTGFATFENRDTIYDKSRGEDLTISDDDVEETSGGPGYPPDSIIDGGGP